MAIAMITHDLGVVAEIADDLIVMYGGRSSRVAGRRSLREAGEPYTWACSARSRASTRGWPARADPRSAAVAAASAEWLPVQSALRVREDICDASCRRSSRSTAARPSVPLPSRRELVRAGRRRAPGARHRGRCMSRRLDGGSRERRYRLAGAGAGTCGRLDGGSQRARCRRPARERTRRCRWSRTCRSIFRQQGDCVPARGRLRQGGRRRQLHAERGRDARGRRRVGLWQVHHGRLIARLLQPTGGKIIFDGRDITNLSRAEMRPMRREMRWSSRIRTHR